MVKSYHFEQRLPGKRGECQGTVEMSGFGQGREEEGDNIVEGVVIFYHLLFSYLSKIGFLFGQHFSGICCQASFQKHM